MRAFTTAREVEATQVEVKLTMHLDEARELHKALERHARSGEYRGLTHMLMEAYNSLDELMREYMDDNEKGSE